MNAIESPALFDLEIDPSETRDVAVDHPEMVEKITKIADSIRAVLGDQLKGIEGKEVRPVGRVD
jgi:hypothetical protein